VRERDGMEKGGREKGEERKERKGMTCLKTLVI